MTAARVILAIDPGIDGALAILGDNLFVADLPTMGEGAHRVINGPLLVKFRRQNR